MIIYIKIIFWTLIFRTKIFLKIIISEYILFCSYFVSEIIRCSILVFWVIFRCIYITHPMVYTVHRNLLHLPVYSQTLGYFSRFLTHRLVEWISNKILYKRKVHHTHIYIYIGTVKNISISRHSSNGSFRLYTTDTDCSLPSTLS